MNLKLIIKKILQTSVRLLCCCCFASLAGIEKSASILKTSDQQRMPYKIDLNKHDLNMAVGKYLSYYIDTDKSKNIADIRNLSNSNWTQSKISVPSFGYTQSAIWFRLQLQNNIQKNDRYIINLANPNLDDIKIFIYANGMLQKKMQLGDRYLFSTREIFDRNFLTPFILEPNKQYEVIIRVSTLGIIQLPLYIQAEKDIAEENQTSLLLWGIYFGLTLMMVFYNFILFISTRDRSYFLFSAFILSNVLFHASFQGFGFQHIWPNHEILNDFLLPISNSFLYIFGGLFISQFVNLKAISLLQYRAMMSVVWFSIMLIISSLFISYQKVMLLNTLMGFPFSIVSVISCVIALRKGNVAVRFFLISWIVFMLAVFILIANKIGMVTSNAFTENVLQIGNALSILLISIALADSINIEKKRRIMADEETLRLEKESRKVKEEKLEAEIQTKEAELKSQSEIITAREEVLLAKAKSKTKSNFLATMSHEIRTPLNGILGMSGMLSETALTVKQQGFLDIITSSGRSLLNLINDILDLSKIESGKMEMEYRVFDVRQLHRETIRTFELLAKDKSIQLICEIDQTVPQYIKSDSNRLQQVLLNLLSNALKFTEKGSIKIKISCVKNADSEDQEISKIIKTEVIDSGIGLNEKQQSKLFHSFSQADGSTTRKYGGTGLGLSISKNIIELLDGKIGVISKENQGANFWFYIPSQPMTDNEISTFKNAQNPRLNQQKQEEARSKLEGLSVLVAEDNKVNQMVIKGMLSNLGMKCYLAENGEEALEHVKSYYEEIDAVLMDCEMPVMDGYQATREIRKWEMAEGKKALPILAVTAHALEEMVQDSLDAGMNGHISKPVVKHTLHDTLLKHLFVNHQE